MTSVVRARMMQRAVCEVLAGEPNGLPVREVIARVKEAVPPDEAELTRNNSGSLRYDTSLRFWTVGLVKAGWVVKDKVWRLTEAGGKALSDFPDAHTFGARVDYLYNEWRKGSDEAREARELWALTDQVLARIPSGRWASFTDLAAIERTDAKHLGIHLWNDLPPGWHRVLRMDGTISADHWGVKGRAAEQRRLLAAEGINVDTAADPSRHLDAVALGALVPRGGRRAWLVRGSSVKGMDLVPSWLTGGFVSLAASQLAPVAPPYEAAAISAAVEAGYSLSYAKKEEKVRDLRAFLTRMRLSDLVVTTSGGQVYTGEITGEPAFVESEGGRSNLRRAVEWTTSDTPADFADVAPELAARMKASSDVVELTEVLPAVEALLPPDVTVIGPEVLEVPAVETAPVVLPRLSAEQSDEVLVGTDWLDELVDLLNAKRQVVLYGPPGTGKTFLALRVASAVAPQENVRLVQFHPAYSYEDFFEGYRPVPGDTGQIAFALKAGPFRRIVEDAREHPDQPFVLIIDEINRANLAKVFGELYFLLEYRDEAIDLLYSEPDSKPFSLPKNVFLIGTMNTADRSIALVDSAMRRRFAFLSLHPDDEHLRPVLRAWLERSGLPPLAADLLDELNRRIEDKDMRIGPSYLMTPAVADEAGLARVWRTAILPLLVEHHYGDESVDVAKRYGLATLLRAIRPDEQTPAQPGEGPPPSSALGVG